MPGTPWSYSELANHWESWQQPYQFGAFYIFPSDEVRYYVDGLRQRHDPRSAAICTAHVSVSEPLPRAVTAEDLAEAATALKSVDPFRLSFSDLHSTTPYPGVVYAIEPADAVRALRDLLHSGSLFSDADLNGADISPHMTVAEFITVEESLALEAELTGHVLEDSWVCSDLVYAVPDDSFTFHVVTRLPLGRRVDR
jgi:hypothetical protein